jgi:hypothetical protein
VVGAGRERRLLLDGAKSCERRAASAQRLGNGQ